MCQNVQRGGVRGLDPRDPNRESKVLEKVTLDFICAAQKIYSRLLQDSEMRSLVFQLEESWGKASPFCQLGALEKVVVKATPVGWTLRTVKFMLETQIAFPRDFNASTLASCQQESLFWFS